MLTQHKLAKFVGHKEENLQSLSDKGAEKREYCISSSTIGFHQFLREKIQNEGLKLNLCMSICDKFCHSYSLVLLKFLVE